MSFHELLKDQERERFVLTYEELKKSYKAMQKCSELGSENEKLKKSNEDKELRIEHLTELVLKRNKMLFGQKSEKAKFINDGQLAFEGIFNEAEAESDKSAAEPIIEKVIRKSKFRRIYHNEDSSYPRKGLQDRILP